MQGFSDRVDLYLVHRPISLNHNMGPNVEAELLRISWAKQTHTGNACHVDHMQHARIDTDEEVRFGH